MKRALPFLPLLALVMLAQPARAQNTAGTLDPSFPVGVGGLSVNALAVQPDGKVVLGGEFTSVDGSINQRSNLARLTAQGAVDTDFNPPSGADGIVRCIAVQPNGKIVIGGDFANVGGQPRAHIARLNPDGSVEDTTTFNASADGSVTGLAIQSDGHILILGSFANVDSTARQGLARLNQNGSLDGNFAPDTGGSSLASMALEADDSLILSGEFLTVNSQPHVRLVHINASGSVDAAFVASTDVAATCMAVQADGKILIGGSFTSVNGVTQTGLVRLTALGATDPNFTSSTVTGVDCMALQADGKILIAGAFTDVGGQARNHLARVASDGTLEGTGTFVSDSHLNGDVLALQLQADGGIVAGGTFSLRAARFLNDAPIKTLQATSASRLQWLRGGSTPEVLRTFFELSVDGGATWSSHGQGARINGGWELIAFNLPASALVRARAENPGGAGANSSGFLEQIANTSGKTPGAVDSGFAPVVKKTSGGSAVFICALQPDRKIMIGGNFTSVNGNVGRQDIDRLLSDGTTDFGFDAGFSAGTPIGLVFQVLVQTDGKLLISGSFSSVLGQPRAGLARLNADGSLDAAFAPQLPDITGSLAIRALLLQPDGKIVVAFNQSNGQEVARLNQDGTPDGAFTPATTPFSFSALALQGDKILVGGNFTLINGQQDGGLVRLEPDGTIDASFDSTVGFSFRNSINCLAVQPDGKILLAGSAANGITRLAPDGSADPDFVVGTGPQNDSHQPQAQNLALQTDGRIIVAGNFTSFNGQPRLNFAQLNPDGSLVDTDGFNAGNSAGVSIQEVVQQADGALIVVGQFSAIQGQSLQNVARLLNDPAYQNLAMPDATQLKWTRRAAAPEVQFATFDLSTDGGGTWSPLGLATRAGDTWQLTGLSLPASGMIRARGRTIGGLAGSNGGLIEQLLPFGADTTTAAPSFTSPRANSTNKNPVLVSFNLPEAAASGTVKLNFDDGVNSAITLVLAASQESAGDHAFSFNPANPASAPEIAGGQPIVDGTYAVTLSYQDALGNPPASVAHAMVKIDTAAPVLTAPDGGFSPDSFASGGTLPDYRSQVGTSEPATLVQSPTPGMQFFGTQTVHVMISGTDDAGNPSNTLNFDVGVIAHLTNPVTTVLVSTGQPTPGAGVTDGPPSDAVTTSFGVPAIDDAGHLAFLAQWSSKTKGRGRGIFRLNGALAKVGDPVPGITGAKFTSFTDPVVDAGLVASIATLGGAPKPPASAVVSFDLANSNAFAIVARAGDAATGDGAMFRSFREVAVAGDYIGFLAQLAPGTGTTPKTTAASDLGLWVKEGANPLVLALREQQSIGGHTIKTIVSFAGGNGSPGQGRGWLRDLRSPGALVMALCLFTDRTQAVVAVDPSDVTTPIVLSQTGTTGNGGPDIAGDSSATFASYGVPAAAGTGHSAFAASLTIGGGVTRANARGIFAALNGTTAYAPIARVGDDSDIGSGAKFIVLKDVVLASDGGLAFPAALKGGTVRGLAASTLWWQPPGGSLTRLAQGGGPVGDLPGAQWKSFLSLAIAANRGPIFTATLVPNKGGVKATTAIGAWATDYQNHTRLLFRAGDTIAGKTLRKFTLLKATRGSTGVTRGFNSAQQIAWLATFSGKTVAVMLTDVP